MSFIINKPEITNIGSIPIFNSTSIEGVPINSDSSSPSPGQSLVYDSSTGKWILIDISSVVGSTGPTGSSEITGGGVQTITFSDDDFSSTRTSFMISSLEKSSITNKNLKCYGKTTGFNNCKTSYSFGVNEQNTKWISVGESYTGSNASIAFSIDGVSWSTQINSTGILNSGNDLDWDGNVWVAVGTPGTTTNSSIVFSRNGLDWQSATGSVDIFNYEVRSVRTDGDRWIAVGSTGAVNNVCYSDDGIVWKPCTYTTGNLDPYCIGYNGCFWLIGGEMISYTTNNTIVKYSYDGITWVDNSVTFGQLSGGTTRRLTSICWNGVKWILGAYFNVDLGEVGCIIYTFTNGLNPVFSTLNPLVNGVDYNMIITNIKWNGKMFIAAGYNPFNALLLPDIAVYLYSYDGVEWNYVSAGVENSSAASIFGNILNTDWDGTKWVAVGIAGLGDISSGFNTTGYSCDGINWVGVESAPVTPPLIPPISYNPILFTKCNSVRRNVQYKNKVSFPQNQLIIISSSTSYIGNGTLSGTSAVDINTWRSIPITGNKACWNGEKWILVRSPIADPNTLYYSYDGFNWVSLGNSTFPYQASDCIWDGTKFIAVGAFTIAYSFDGFVWIQAPNISSIFNDCKKIYFNGDKYVSLGTGTYSLAYSTDGINWIGSSNIYTAGNSIKYNGKIWISVGSGLDTIAYSNDGINWTGLGNSIFSTAGNTIEWNGYIWVAGGEGTNSLAYSYDGISWTGLGTSIFTRCKNIIWEGKRFIAVGVGSGVSLSYSYNGINWYVESGTDFGNNGLAWNNPDVGKVNIKPTLFSFGISSNGNTIANSSDGIRWKAQGNSVFTKCYNMYFNGDMYVSVGEGDNSIAYSYDGLSWVGLGNGIFSKGKCVSWNGEKWVAGGEGVNTIAYSVDGIHWTGVGNSIFSTSGNGVIWTGVRWIMVGGGGNEVSYSTDGIIWTAVSTAFSGGVGYGINMSSSKIVAVGSGSGTQIIYSTDDGLTWSSASTTIFGVSGSGRSVIWNGVNWTAVGGPTVSIATSNDGVTWSSVSSKFSGGFARSVCWYANKWIVSGDPNTSPIVYSGNGTDWYDSDATSSLFSECYLFTSYSVIRTTYIPNTINMRRTEQLVITAPDYYDKSVTSPIDISFVLNNLVM